MADNQAVGGQGMIRVKFMTKAPADHGRGEWLKRFPGNRPFFGNCAFVFDPHCDSYDWLVVYDDLPMAGGRRRKHWEEALHCPRGRTILITTEPSTIKPYGQGFMQQFGYILTSQEPWCVRHPGAIFSQPGLIWFYGNHGDGASYDYLCSHWPEEKQYDLSTVCSEKRQRHTLHNDRYRFTQRLKSDFPTMDVFGHGVRYIEDKSEALDPYRYHLAIENHIAPHHWTEKLSDCFLGMSLPFYYGCPNVFEYFPEKSLIEIDIFKYDEAVERIRQALRDDEYSARLPALREARDLFLKRYCTFALLSAVIEERHSAASSPASGTEVILSRHAWRQASPVHQLSFALEKSYFRMRHSLFRLFKHP